MRPLVRRLAGTPITPDALTGLRLATGLGAASCFAGGSNLLAIGAGLFLVSMLLDRADGELARHTGRFSRFGGRLDLVADCVSNMAAFVGLGIGLSPDWTTPWLAYAIGLLAAASTAFIFLRLNATGAVGANGSPSCRPFDPEDALLLVPVVVWCGGASWILLASGVLTPIAALLVAAAGPVARRGARRLSRGNASA